MAGPIDGGRTWRGRRVLGDHKTWRGLVVGVLAGALTFALQQAIFRAGWLQALALLDYDACSPLPGALLGFGALLGDAVKSFFKRGLGIAPGGTWIPFDQLDFLVGAWLCVLPVVTPPLLPLLCAAPIVFVGTLAVTAGGAGLGLKESWI